MALTKVARREEIPAGKMIKYDVGDLELTAVNVDGEFFAFEDRCPHMNSPLHQGKLEGKEVVCPFHKARFDVATGKKTTEPRVPIPRAIKLGALMASIRTHDLVVFPVQVQDRDVYVDI